MTLLTGALGAPTYTALQAPAVAASLNIAGFNGGIALGALLGARVWKGWACWVGAIVVGLAITWMLWQMRRPMARNAQVLE